MKSRRQFARSPQVLVAPAVCLCGCGTPVKAGKVFASGHDKAAEAAVINTQWGSVAQFVLGNATHGYGGHEHTIQPVTTDHAQQTMDRLGDPLPVTWTGIWEPDRATDEPMKSVAAAGPRWAFRIETDRYETWREARWARNAADAQIPNWSNPLSEALDNLDSGLITAEQYEQTLRSIIDQEPADIDAHVHLGNLYYVTATVARNKSNRNAALDTALGFYEAAVAVAEDALPARFGGVLSSIERRNRPVLRANHGLALTLTATGQWDRAEQFINDLLWLEPDNDANLFLLHAVTSRVTDLTKLDPNRVL